MPRELIKSNMLEGGGGGGDSFSLGKWNFETATGTPPSSNSIRLNNSTPESATKLYTHDLDDQGTNYGTKLSGLPSGSIIYVFVDDTTNFQITISASTDQSTYVEFDISDIIVEGTINNGAEVSVSVDVAGEQVDITGKADKDDTIPDGEVLKKKSGGNYEGAGYGADQVVQLNDVDVTDISEGESKILTVLKEVGTGNPVFEGAVQQLDKIVSSSFDSLLADTADWVGDILTLTGDNSNGQLGENGQEHQMNGQFYLCISHVLDVTGSATWVRNRSRDALDPSLSSDQAVITELEDPTGWDSEDTKIISVRSKVGSWYSDVSGYFYACFDESGSNWYWRRIGVPTAEFIQISDQALKDEIEAHDFGATPILKPVATEKGKDRQEHYWETGVSQTGEVLASGDGNTKQFTGNLANTEVNPGSVSITDGSQVVTDDGDGNLIGDIDGVGNNSIDYVTGAYDVTFASAPPSGTDNITADYESEPFTPHLAKCIDDGGTKKWIKQI